MPADETANVFEVGQVVNVPMVVTATGGTPQAPTVTGTTVYAGFDGNKDTVGPVDAIQVVISK